MHECLRAYRQGIFYESLHALGELRFTGIAYDGKTVAATTDKPSRLQVITAMGVVKETQDRSITWTVPTGLYFDNGPKMNAFARVKASAPMVPTRYQVSAVHADIDFPGKG